MGFKLLIEKLFSSPKQFQVTNFIQMYFEFAYYLCICPFRMVPLKNCSGYVTRTWKPQQIFCAILNTLTMFRLFTEVRMHTLLQEPRKKILNPIEYFRMILCIFTFTYKFVIFKRFWMNKKEYLNVLNNIRKDPSLPVSTLKIQHKYFVKAILTFSAGLAFSDYIAGSYFVVPTWKVTPTWWLRQLVSLSRYTFFLGNAPDPEVAPEMSDIYILDSVAAVFTSIGLLQRYIMGIFCDFCILSHVVTLWVTAFTFSKMVQEPKGGFDYPLELVNQTKITNQYQQQSLKWDSIYSQYKAIRRLATIINRALGGLITAFMAEAIMYYSINLDVTLVTLDLYKKVHSGYFYCCTFGILFIAADICSHIATVKVWLANDENRKQVPLDELQIVLHEIATCDIGIKGNNVFTISYSVVAGFCSLIVTYFVICVQQGNQVRVTIMGY